MLRKAAKRAFELLGGKTWLRRVQNPLKRGFGYFPLRRPAAHCSSCRTFFIANEDDKKLADRIETEHPDCHCEICSVGEGSPGPVSHRETLYRIIVDPRDYYDGVILENPYRKVFSNGLSVIRDCASDDEIVELVKEGLTSFADAPIRQIFAICELKVKVVRGETDDQGRRVFAVYDQTVRRADGASTPIPTHAGVFQRVPPAGTQNRSTIQKDHAAKIYQLFCARQIPVSEFRNGLLLDLNRRAMEREFVISQVA